MWALSLGRKAWSTRFDHLIFQHEKLTYKSSQIIDSTTWKKASQLHHETIECFKFYKWISFFKWLGNATLGRSSKIRLIQCWHIPDFFTTTHWPRLSGKRYFDIYRVCHVFWPDIELQFCQSVHMIFKKSFLKTMLWE